MIDPLEREIDQSPTGHLAGAFGGEGSSEPPLPFGPDHSPPVGMSGAVCDSCSLSRFKTLWAV